MVDDAELIKFLLACTGSMAALIVALVKWMLDRQLTRLEAIEKAISSLASNDALQREIGRLEGAVQRAHERIDELLSRLAEEAP